MAAPSTTTTASQSGLADGSDELHYRALVTDAGNSSTSNVISVVVDNSGTGIRHAVVQQPDR